jgi:hypothetical protein
MNLLLAALLACLPVHEQHFKALWGKIEPLEESELSLLIEKRIEKIEEVKEQWRPFVEKEKKNYPLFFSQFMPILDTGALALTPEGCGGTYILYDKNSPSFVIKPIDEQPYCLNNPKSYASPFSKAEHNIPLYHTAEREAFCYELANLIGISSITPFTTLAILSHDSFLLLKDSPNKEKLCSIQEYLKETTCLANLLENFLLLGYQDENFCQFLDNDDFENLSLFLWLTYDNDAHFYNFRTYLKKVDPSGNLVYGIKKIDNALTFPEENKGFMNFLLYLPQANKPLSTKTRLQITLLPVEEIEESMHRFSLLSALPAFRQRVSLLKNLLETENITYYQVGKFLKDIEK